jgi:tetratricopeptide (TPR) repeat protein
MAQVLDYECRIAIPVIRQLLTLPSIPSRPHSQSWINAGMVFELADAVREAASETPERRAQLAELATVIAAALDDTYPAITRAQCIAAAWKEVANVRRYQNQYEAALEALDIADRAMDDQFVNAYEKAILALVRANVYSDLHRPAEARPLLEEAREVFEGHSDQRLVGQCELLAGILYYRDQNGSQAIAAFRSALDAARAAGDTRTAAAAYTNIGVVEAERGVTGAAMDALHQALAIFRELGSRVEIASTNWAVALALLTAGKYESAIRTFRDARGIFLALGLAEEAGLAGVEMAEAYLAMGRRAAASRVILAVIEEFREGKLNERALEALSYLRDLGPEASPQAAQHVYSYLVRLRTEPALLFHELRE